MACGETRRWSHRHRPPLTLYWAPSAKRDSKIGKLSSMVSMYIHQRQWRSDPWLRQPCNALSAEAGHHFFNVAKTEEGSLRCCELQELVQIARKLMKNAENYSGEAWILQFEFDFVWVRPNRDPNCNLLGCIFFRNEGARLHENDQNEFSGAARNLTLRC